MQLVVDQRAAGENRLSEPELLCELAVVLYQREKLPLGRAARLAGMKKFQFNELLAARGIPIHYGLHELQQDLETARTLAEH